MMRENLDFLKPMFQHNDIHDFNLLIVNQTTKDKVLVSDNPKIKVLNSFEFGVPKSRNLAIQNASFDICLMADDDIVYKPNLHKTIIEAYKKNEDASMVSFEAVDEDENKYTNYPSEGIHTKKSLKKIYTWVISFRRAHYHKEHILYNDNFGFGATFQGNEEYVFLRNAFDSGLKMVHVSKTIVMHPYESSGRKMGSDNAVFARAALIQRFYGNLSYLWVFRYIIFLVRNGHISTKEIIQKLQTGFRGIKTYKELDSQGKI
ncbi:glycosyltransferase [Psychroserpens sp. XS_ASV72]|uniref:glycosyltransferase n=1 Tax=Psychroserpens sp. XS_ASV72 TaxID=3241293 RepID=UPI003513A685